MLVEVDADYLSKAVKPKQFIHIDQTECIMCEGCVDICPWKCIHMVSPDAIAEASDTEQPGLDPSDNVLFIIDDDICTRCQLCVDRCPTGVIILGKVGRAGRSPATRTSVPTTTATPTACGSEGTKNDGKDPRRDTPSHRQGPPHQGGRRRAGQPGLEQHLPARLASSARATPTARATAATSS